MSGKYSIPVTGLKTGLHKFDFEIGNKFFEKFEESEIEEGSLVVDIELDKRASHLDLTIKISGDVSICCDRCLEMFFYPVDCMNRLIVKFGTGDNEIDPDIVLLTSEEHELDLQQHIYEFVHLSLPIKKIHPDDKSGNSTCNPEMLEKLEVFKATHDNNEEDSRWDKLKKLINDN